jgi:hypothetical protein
MNNKNCPNKFRLQQLLLNSKLMIINKDYGIGRIIQLIIQDLKNLSIKENIKKYISQELIDSIIKILTNILNKETFISLKKDIENPLIELFSINKNLFRKIIIYLFNSFLKDKYGLYIILKNNQSKNNQSKNNIKDNGTILEQSQSNSIIANLLLDLDYIKPEYFSIEYFISKIFLNIPETIMQYIEYSSIAKKNSYKSFESFSCTLFNSLSIIPDFVKKKFIYKKIALFSIIKDGDIKSFSPNEIPKSNLEKFIFDNSPEINNKYSGNCVIKDNILNINLIQNNNNIKKYYFSKFVLSYKVIKILVNDKDFNKSNNNLTSIKIYNFIKDDINFKKQIFGIINTIFFLEELYEFTNDKLKIKLKNIITINEKKYNIFLFLDNKSLNNKLLNNYFVKVKINNDFFYRPINNYKMKRELLKLLNYILLNKNFDVKLLNDDNKIIITLNRDTTSKEFIIKKSSLFNFEDLEYLSIKYKS